MISSIPEVQTVLFDIRTAVIPPQTADGEELVPVIEYDGSVLEEGVDYTWEKKEPSDEFTDPGSYSIIVNGKGQYTGRTYMTFVIEAPVIKGDVNGDSTVTIDDATMLQKYLAEFDMPDNFVLKACDTNGDGFVSIGDVTEIQRYLAEKEAPEGIGKPIV